jgi:hypothetical protein
MTQTLAACPPLISDIITNSKHYIDNLFADTEAEIQFPDKRRRFYNEEWYRNHGSGISIAAVEVAQHVIDSCFPGRPCEHSQGPGKMSCTIY